MIDPFFFLSVNVGFHTCFILDEVSHQQPKVDTFQPRPPLPPRLDCRRMCVPSPRRIRNGDGITHSLRAQVAPTHTSEYALVLDSLIRAHIPFPSDGPSIILHGPRNRGARVSRVLRSVSRGNRGAVRARSGRGHCVSPLRHRRDDSSDDVEPSQSPCGRRRRRATAAATATATAGIDPHHCPVPFDPVGIPQLLAGVRLDCHGCHAEVCSHGWTARPDSRHVVCSAGVHGTITDDEHYDRQYRRYGGAIPFPHVAVSAGAIASGLRGRVGSLAIQ